MSLVPINVTVICTKCGNTWVEQKNTLDPSEATCPKCEEKMVFY